MSVPSPDGTSHRLLPFQLAAWIECLAPTIIGRAAGRSPHDLAARLEEEWLADLSTRPGQLARIRFALGCCWAAGAIARDYGADTVPGTPSPASSPVVMACVRRPRGFRRPSPPDCGTVLCEINTTPLIDVMLVMLVTLIITLPTLTHTVTLELPQAHALAQRLPPEVIDLDIDADGTIAWNGATIFDRELLERRFRAEAVKSPQPEMHIRADRHAKYGVVAQVLASAQRSRMQKIGFADTAMFRD
jgi:biopolymer transport protein ExbD